MNIERALTIAGANAGVFTTRTPTIPPNIAAAVASGALEFREQASLNTTTNILTLQGFTVQPGSPSPTPSANLPFAALLYYAQIQILNTYFSCTQAPGVLMVGRVLNNSPGTPFGDLTGATIAIGFGYTTANPPQINNLTILVPGLAGLYSPSATGTLTFPTSSVNPPGTSGAAPQIIFAPGQAAFMSTSLSPIGLDYSPSKDPNNLQLTFTIAQITTGLPTNDVQAVNAPVAIAGANTSRPTISFAGVKGNYYFRITATNSQGVSSTQQVVVQYTGN